MQFVKKYKNKDGKTIIEAKNKFLFFRIKRKFIAESRACKSYWNWLELPEYNLVSDSISFQLDAWNRNIDFNY